LSTYASFVTEPFPTQSKEWRRARDELRRWGARRIISATKGSAYAGVLRDLSDDGIWDQFSRMCDNLSPVLPLPLSIAYLPEGVEYETVVQRVLTEAIIEAEKAEQLHNAEEAAKEDTRIRSLKAIRLHYADKRRVAEDLARMAANNPDLEQFLPPNHRTA
jgi:hypothetical protein